MLISLTKEVKAQEVNYQIENLESRLTIQNDYSLLVESIIDINFYEKNQGLIWYVPYTDKVNNKNKSESQNRVKILSITNGRGELLPYKVEIFGLHKKIVIGDANKTVLGRQVYRIKYLRKNVVNEVNGQVEFWWGLVGDFRNGQVNKTQITIESPYLKIQKVEVVKMGTIANENHNLITEENKVVISFDSPIQPIDNLIVKASLEKTNKFQIKEELIKILNNKMVGLISLVVLGGIVMVIHDNNRESYRLPH